jgi:hypothetical protein
MIHSGVATEARFLRPASAWGLLLGLALVRLSLHLYAAGVWGYDYMTDELYYLDCADRLDWGYVDHPPLSVGVLWLARAAIGESLLAIRFLPALIGSAVVVLTGLMAREMGGHRSAQGLAALAAVAFPIHMGATGFYSMNAIDLLVWSLAMLVVLRLINEGDPRWWIGLGVLLGLGLLNKLSVSWLGIGLVVGLVATPERRWLWTPWPWIAAAIAVAIVSPYVLWQIEHDWPFVEFTRNAQLVKLVPRPPLRFAGEQLVVANPLLAPFWMAGLLYYFLAEDGRSYRLLAWLWLTVFTILLLSGFARAHYLAPAYPVAIAGGGLAFAHFARRRRWLLPLTAALLAIAGALFVPLILPVMSPRAYVALAESLPIGAPEEDVGGEGKLPVHLSLQFVGRAAIAAAAEAFHSLPADERDRAGILTETFGSAGAINRFGAAVGLPAAIGTHNNYWLWGPGSYTGEVMVVLASPDSRVLEVFEKCEYVASIRCEYCMPLFTRKAAYVCRRSERPLAEVWPQLKSYW